MKHAAVFPLVTHPVDPELFTGAAAKSFAQVAERAGFHGISFTDHPAPSHKWLMAGGHDALDPFAALAFVAGVTEQLRLIPHVVVLPYRNPFVVAKAAATIDGLSDGRFILSVATGYLRSEYRSLGVDFERRNELFDDALAVLRGVWSTDEFSYEGTTFTAGGVTANPKPKHIPIWIGGNSARTRRRVAQYGDGWNPFHAPAELAKTTRTAALETVADLAPMLADLERHVEAEDRDPGSIDVQFGVPLSGPGTPTFSAAAHLDSLADLADLGVTWNSVTLPGASLAQALDALEQYGAEVIAKET